jgi:two-component system, OmpR family, sensor histidine kinase KdpD
MIPIARVQTIPIHRLANGHPQEYLCLADAGAATVTGMGNSTAVRRRTTGLASYWPAVAAWAAGWAGLVLMDGRVDLANLAMLLVLSSAVASLWLPVAVSLISNTVAVMAFNWTFVPPRGTFFIDLRQHALLLGAMLVVNSIIAALMAAQRAQARLAQRHAMKAEQLRTWGDTLRDAIDPLAQVGALHAALVEISGGPVAMLVLKDRTPLRNDDDAALRVGEADADQLAGLWHCLRQGQPLGPGTGRYEQLADWYLPLRGRSASVGAAVLRGHGIERIDPQLRGHAQALCDQLGLALQRAMAGREEQRTREQAQAQGVRNALLAAISHDYRTPLATIMGAASSLEEQADRLSAEQRQRLAHSIVEETAQLSRLTDNTLQLARLDAPGVTLRCDWESAEEMVGTALRHARRRDPTRRVRARLEPDLPLLWCDAMLMSQLLDNLVDNALKYSPREAPVEIVVRQQDEHVVLAVLDRGPGIAPAWRERVFEVFHRGAESMAGATSASADHVAARPGAGVGLAVCRAIARAHVGELRLRPRGHGGCSFECVLPIRQAPEQPTEEAPAA